MLPRTFLLFSTFFQREREGAGRIPAIFFLLYVHHNCNQTDFGSSLERLFPLAKLQRASHVKPMWGSRVSWARKVSSSGGRVDSSQVKQMETCGWDNGQDCIETVSAVNSYWSLEDENMMAVLLRESAFEVITQ